MTLNLLVQNTTSTKRNKYLNDTELERLQTIGVLYYQDNNFRKPKRPLVNILMKKLRKSKNTIYAYLKHYIVEQRDSQEKFYYIFSTNALKTHFLRSAVASSYKGKSSSAAEFLRLIDMIILSDKSIGKKTSPEQAINLFECFLKPTPRYADIETICLKTYYTYVLLGITQVSLMDLPEIVSRKTAVKRPRSTKSTKGTSIHEREFALTDRSEFGHWEGDCVIGSRDGQHKVLFTMVERKTGFATTHIVQGTKMKYIRYAINKLERRFGCAFKHVFKSITFDNGSEFSDPIGFEKSVYNGKRTVVFYADSYASYQRGTNERFNREMRRYIPKGTPFDDVPQKTIDLYDSFINSRLLARHEFKSPKELFDEEVEKMNRQIAEFDIQQGIAA